jgi:hypothetical protein
MSKTETNMGKLIEFESPEDEELFKSWAWQTERKTEGDDV